MQNLTEKERKEGADYMKALKICKQDSLKDHLKDSYIEHLERVLNRITKEKTNEEEK